MLRQVKAGKTQLNGLQGGHSAGGGNSVEGARDGVAREREMEALGKGERDSARREGGVLAVEMGERRERAMMTVGRRDR